MDNNVEFKLQLTSFLSLAGVAVRWLKETFENFGQGLQAKFGCGNLDKSSTFIYRGTKISTYQVNVQSGKIKTGQLTFLLEKEQSKYPLGKCRRSGANKISLPSPWQGIIVWVFCK